MIFRYSISFIAEGLLNIKPLIFIIEVHTQNIIYGISDAINKLNSLNFLYNNNNRQIMNNKNKLVSFIERLKDEINDMNSLLKAVKLSLLLVYNALPTGSLNTQNNKGNKKINILILNFILFILYLFIYLF